MLRLIFVLLQDDEKACQGLQTKRPSLMGKIVGMLQRKESMPMQTYKRTRRVRGSPSPSSSSSSSDGDESRVLLKAQGRPTDSRCRMRNICRRETVADEQGGRENLDTEYPRAVFVTKQMPRFAFKCKHQLRLVFS